MKLKRTDYGFIAAMLILMIIQLWKAQYSPGFEDEHFYITLGQRLSFGDALFYDDWHVAQMISVFIYPLYELFVMMFKGTDGIVLGFRVFYVLVQMVICIVLYIKFRKYGLYTILGIVIFMLYTPFNIMALSYNTMSIVFIVLFLCAIPQNESIYQRLRFMLSGTSYALAVLNTPYLAFGYFVYVVVCVTLRTLKKETFYCNIRTCFIATCGIVLPAMVFVVFVLSRASLSEIFSTLKFLIDPGHSTGILMMFLTNGYRLLVAFSIFLPLYLLEIVMCYVDKKDRKYTNIIFYSSISLTICSVIYVCFVNMYQFEIGSYMNSLVPFSLLGLITFLLIKNKKDKGYLLVCMLVPFFHGFVISVSSNVGTRTLASPLVVTSFFTVILLGIFINENKVRKVIPLLVIVLFILNLAYFKMFHLYGYGTNGQFNHRIEKGPLTGLIVSADYALSYSQKLSDIEEINGYAGYTAFISSDVWMYLASTNDYGLNSSLNYFYSKEEYLNCVDEYLAVHSHKRPIYIYVGDTNKAQLNVNDPWLKKLKKVKRLNTGYLFVLDK